MYKQIEEHAFKRIQEDLKDDNISSVILLCGKEGFLIDWARNILISRFINESSRLLDLVYIDENEIEDMSISEAIIDASETLPILSEKKVVIVEGEDLLNVKDIGRNSKSEVQAISEYIKDIPDSTLLIFTGVEADKNRKLPRAIAAIGKVYDFGTLDKVSLRSFINKRFKEAEITISAPVMEYLIDETGYYNQESDYDLFRLNNDIIKLIAISADQNIRKEDVDQVVVGDIDTFIFSLINSISENDKGKALNLIHNIAGEDRDVFSLAGMIINHFEMMLSIKELLDDGIPDRVIVEKLAIKPARLRFLKPVAMRITQDKINNLLFSAYSLDRNIKTGLLKPGLALEMFVSGM